MDKQEEHLKLLDQFLAARDADTIRNIVAKNMESVTPEFFEYLDDLMENMARESREELEQGAKKLQWVKGAIETAVKKSSQQEWEEKAKGYWKTIPIPIPPDITKYYDIAFEWAGFDIRQVPQKERYAACEVHLLNAIRFQIIDELTHNQLKEYSKLRTPQQQVDYLSKHLRQPKQLWNWGLYKMRRELKKARDLPL